MRPTLPGRLEHFFSGYAEGSDFEFLRADCHSTLQAFVNLRNVSVDEVVRNAKRFFRDKRKIAYRPDARRLRIEPRGTGQIVFLPVTMSWSSPIPKEWGPDWPTWDDDPRVLREVTVHTEIELDADGRILRYVEKSVERPRLRVTGAENCEASTYSTTVEPWIAPREGELVRDLGETVIVGLHTKGYDIARKVATEDGSGWTLHSVSFAVENPFGGTSAGGSDCLVSADKK